MNTDTKKKLLCALRYIFVLITPVIYDCPESTGLALLLAMVIYDFGETERKAKIAEIAKLEKVIKSGGKL
jgi:hypothetical protein